MGKESESKTAWASAIRNAKNRLGLNVKDLAKKAGIAHGTVVKIMQGDSGVLLRHIEAVTVALGLKAEITINDKPPAVIIQPVEISNIVNGIKVTIKIEQEQ